MLSIHSNPLFARHHTGVGHPERPERLLAARTGVLRAGASSLLMDDTPVHPDTARMIARVHSTGYAAELDLACRTGARLFHSLDNPISLATHQAAHAAVGVSLTAAENIWANQSVSSAFVIARPPGHHAERTSAMGFCFFNTIACVAEWLLERPAIERVFILDWDVHHGNGTQHLFEDRPDVFYSSIHRFPFYPGTGAASEAGIGDGEGFTRNIPMAGGAGDADYLRRFEKVIVPDIESFRPDAILISAGFDAHERDPLGGMKVSAEAFGEMTRLVTDAARRHCEGRVLSLLEGGYDAEGLASSVAEHVAALSDSKGAP
jgi:acetoin utilization deacetylase AcuC-like enzyme